MNVARLNLITRIGLWLLLLGSAFAQQGTPIRSFGTLPATCQGGKVGQSTDAAVQVSGTVGTLNICTSANTWALVFGTSLFPLGPVTAPNGANASLGPSSNNNNPIAYQQNGDNSWDTWAGVDTYCSNSAGPPCRSGGSNSAGTLEIYKRLWINDTQQTPVAFKNSFVTINHYANGTQTILNNQDRALASNVIVPSGDSNLHYGIEAMQAEADWDSNSATIEGNVDTEITAGSFQTADNRASGNLTFTGGVNFNALRGVTDDGTATPAPTVTGCGIQLGSTNASGLQSACYSGTYTGVAVTNGFWGDGTISKIGAVGINAFVTDNTSGDTHNMVGASVVAMAPGHRFKTMNIGLYAQAQPNVFATGGEGDWGLYIDNDQLGDGNSFFNGSVYMAEPMGTGIGTSQLANPSAPVVTVQGTTGSATISYEIVYLDASGQPTAHSTATTVTNANATLSGSNFNAVQTSASQYIPWGTYCVNVYRTATNGTSPTTTGLINQFCGPQDTIFAPGYAINDTGLAGDGSTPPTVNATGGLTGYAVKTPSYSTSTNCAATGTAANPSVVSCSAAAAGSFSCSTSASTGTCVVDTTAVTANSQIFVQQRSDTTTGTRLGVTCNTNAIAAPTDITAVTAGTSFTISLGTFSTNPECFSYFIVN